MNTRKTARRLLPSLLSAAFFFIPAVAATAEHDGKIQILLLGDSTTEGRVPRIHAPEGPHLEQVVRSLLAAEKDLPPTNVINAGKGGDYLQLLLEGGRYDKEIAKLPGLDYIFIRYGLNDFLQRKDFAENFPKDFHALLARLRKDHPQAVLIPMTVIPYRKDSVQTNALIKKVAEDEKLPLLDIFPRYQAESKEDPNALVYRQIPLSKIPEPDRESVKAYVVNDKKGVMVQVMDNKLDAQFGKLPAWFANRHPNLAGYRVIGEETVKFLVPMIRGRDGKNGVEAKN